MFVSVVCDMGSEDSLHEVYSILPQYGFEKVQKACFESTRASEKSLVALKRDIDKATDYYDTIRIYQYPVDGKLAISILKQNQWKKIVVKAPLEQLDSNQKNIAKQIPDTKSNPNGRIK